MTDTETGAEATAAAAEPATEPATEAAPSGPPSRGGLSVPWIVAISLFVISVGMAVLAASQRSALTAERNDRKTVEQTAGQLASALVTYDYQRLDEWKAKVVSLGTGKFRRTFEETYDRSLKPLLEQTHGKSTGTVKSVFVTGGNDGSASAIAVIDTVADGAAGRRAVFDTYIQLDLVKVNGAWRVDDVTNLNLGGASAGGNASPGTSVPATNK